MRARRTYLEMLSPQSLRPAASPALVPDIREEQMTPAAYRALYLGVGEAYHWTDRAAWSDEQIAAHLAQTSIGVWVARVGGEPAGYFELRRGDDQSIEIAYFGLLPGFIGCGLGGHLLTEAARIAWTSRPTRVWLHTSTLDHPAALANYLKRGFSISRTEEYEV